MKNDPKTIKQAYNNIMKSFKNDAKDTGISVQNLVNAQLLYNQIQLLNLIEQLVSKLNQKSNIITPGNIVQ